MGYLGGCFLFVVRLISWRRHARLLSFAVLSKVTCGFAIKSAFRPCEKLPHFFTIHYSLLLRQKPPGRDKWKMKSEEVIGKNLPKLRPGRFLCLQVNSDADFVLSNLDAA